MTPTLPIMIYTFCLGLCIGSFLNVCIHRLPESRSIVRPGSTCPKCDTAIRFYDNIPLLSYLWLRGRCRACAAPISLRYPLVELLSGLMALAVVMKFGPTLQGLVLYLFICALLAVAFIDLDHRIIPDVITLPGIILFFIASFALPNISVQDALWGILAGGGTLLAVAWGYNLLTGKEGMGGGDIKLLAMIGAVVGWKGVFFTIFMSSAVGTVAGVLLMVRARSCGKLIIPYGPFLSIAAVTYIFFGNDILSWYLGLIRP
jgi:leader peptidase (prepilin peptidase) / N-methyltransferase